MYGMYLENQKSFSLTTNLLHWLFTVNSFSLPFMHTSYKSSDRPAGLLSGLGRILQTAGHVSAGQRHLTAAPAAATSSRGRTGGTTTAVEDRHALHSFCWIGRVAILLNISIFQSFATFLYRNTCHSSAVWMTDKQLED